MNPFRKSPAALRPLVKKDQARWVCPQSAWKELEEHVIKETNAVVLGVKGSGKTTLLRWFFSAEYCRQAAQDGKIIFFADLSDTNSVAELCSYLTTKLQKAVENFWPEESEERKVLQASLETSAKNGSRENVTFINACESLYEAGYTLLLVMDCFEYFLSSDAITQEQHDMLKGLLDKDVMRCIVATDYDLEKSSLAPGIVGSLYLQKFQDKIILRGFSEEETKAYINGLLGADSPVSFSDKHLDFIGTVTGRIPALVEMAACIMYDELEKEGSIKPKDVRDELYKSASPMMGSWCKYFTPEYVKTIQTALFLIGDKPEFLQFSIPGSDKERTNAAERLEERGFWRNIHQNDYTFNCLLLQMYFQRGEYVPPKDLGKEPSAPKTEWKLVTGNQQIQPEQKQSGTYITNHITIIGETVELGTNHITNQTFSPVLFTKDLLGMLTDSGNSRESFAELLYSRLTQNLPTNGLVGIDRRQDMSDAEFDSLYDSAFSEQLSDKVVDDLKVDDEAELVDITDEEQMSLDRRFEEVRAVTRPRLTDAILDKVSPRTAFYLKLSVVVEDALSILKLLHVKSEQIIDCSAHLILYGKAVEQQLKDCFFSLFHREETLRDYQIKSEDAGWTTFQSVAEERTSIGNYMHALGDNAAYLGRLCAEKGITLSEEEHDQNYWCSFWQGLRQKINEARIIRNLSAHTNPSDCPGWSDVDRIAELSFEQDENIFGCSTVGKALNTAIFGNGSMGIAEGKALEGTEAIFCCKKVKQNGGVDGILEENNCLAKVAPSKAKSFTQANPDWEILPQGRYRVRLLEYREQDRALYFAVELLAPAD